MPQPHRVLRREKTKLAYHTYMVLDCIRSRRVDLQIIKVYNSSGNFNPKIVSNLLYFYKSLILLDWFQRRAALGESYIRGDQPAGHVNCLGCRNGFVLLIYNKLYRRGGQFATLWLNLWTRIGHPPCRKGCGSSCHTVWLYKRGQFHASIADRLEVHIVACRFTSYDGLVYFYARQMAPTRIG